MFASVPTFCIVLLAPAFAYDVKGAAASLPVRRYGLKTRKGSPHPACSSLSQTNCQLHQDHCKWDGSSCQPKTADDAGTTTSDSVHCVVWGDGPVEGMNFINKEEAGAHFDYRKQVDVVALHFDANMHELQRYVSPRLLNVKYNMMAEWCKNSKHQFLAGLSHGGNMRSAAVPTAFGQMGSLKEGSAAPSDPESMESSAAAASPSESASDPLNEMSAPLAPVQAEQVVQPHAASTWGKDSGLWTGSAADAALGRGAADTVALSSYEEPSVPASASTTENRHEGVNYPSSSYTPSKPYERFAPQGTSLTDKVALIEEALRAIGANANALLSKVGVDDMKIASILQKPLRKIAARTATTNKKVTTRVQELNDLIPELHAKVGILEEEIHGSAQESSSTKAPLKLSLKKKVDELVQVVDGLGKRVYDLDIKPYFADVGKMEEIAQAHKPNLINLAVRVGVTPMDDHVSTAGKNSHLKKRINHLERFVSEAHRSTIALEMEMAENGPASASLLQQATKQTSIKDRIESLKKDFESLTKRHAAMDGAGAQTKLETLSTLAKEGSEVINSMVSKTGLDIMGQETKLKGNDETIKAQIGALEGLVSDMHRKVFSLEEELSGSGNKLTTDLPKARGANAKIKALESTLKSLKTRADELKNKV